ncbi:HK97 gp10 family phage protein [Methyloversatilis sp.]|uniref:HK97 gp10 family phage protein n=1 Tax=Methyloversatilis sp. TaxID=2569862 RepID=UPI0035B4F24B
MDIDNLSGSLIQVGEKTVRGVAGIMQEAGKEIQKRAVEYAPVDEGDLENAIKYSAERTGRRGRVMVFIFIDEDMPTSDGKRVGSYARKMHEQLAPYGTGRYNLGPKSREKRDAGADVGGKFLERAINELRGKVYERVDQLVKRIK